MLTKFGVDIDEPELMDHANPLEKIGEFANGLRDKVSAALKRGSKKDIYNDAAMSFHFAMGNSIFMTTHGLSNSTEKAFKKWIGLLENTLPPTWKQMHKPLGDISHKIKSATKSEKTLLKILEPSKPKTIEWSESCTKGDKFAGYTCGLWELFHIMTLGVVEWNKGVTNEWAVITAEDAANILHDYISNFFACDVCRKNFLQMYDACEHDRCNRLGTSETSEKEWKQLPLWLWETHNSVNVRLLHERHERDGKPKPTQEEIEGAQFPLRRECPKCWHDDGTYSEMYVYQYLRLTYWLEDDVNKKLRTKFERSMRIHRERMKQLKIEEALDDDANGESMPLYVPGLIVMAIGSVLLVAWTKKIEKDKSGRHKKIDSVA